MDSTPLRKLARSQMRSWATRHLKVEQEGKCPVCGEYIDLLIKGEGVIDHDHDTGEIRGILHRSCNAAEGKVANAAGRWGAKSMRYESIVQWLQNLLEYYKRPGTGMMYYAHQTPDEKKDATAAKQRARRAEAKAKLALRARRVYA